MSARVDARMPAHNIAPAAAGRPRSASESAIGNARNQAPLVNAKDGRLYKAAEYYTWAAEGIASTTYKVTKATGQCSAAVLSTLGSAVVSPVKSLENAAYWAVGGNNFRDARAALSTKPDVTVKATMTDAKGRESEITTVIPDQRTAPQMIGESIGHAMTGLFKIPMVATGAFVGYTGAKVTMGALSLPGVSHVASGLTTMVVGGAKLALTNPKATLTVGGMASGLYVAANGCVNFINADSLKGKIGYGLQTAGGLVAMVAVPVLSIFSSTVSQAVCSA